MLCAAAFRKTPECFDVRTLALDGVNFAVARGVDCDHRRLASTSRQEIRCAQTEFWPTTYAAMSDSRDQRVATPPQDGEGGGEDNDA